MFEENKRATLQVDMGLLVGLAARDGAPPAAELLRALCTAVRSGLGELPRPSEEVQRATGSVRRDVWEAWEKSFLAIEAYAIPIERELGSNEPQAEDCVRVVRPDGTEDPALTALARLATTMLIEKLETSK